MELSSAPMRLRGAYRAMEPVRTIVSLARELGGGSLSAEAQTFLLQKCLLDEVCRKYSPDNTYTRRVLKEVILAAEQDGEEVVDGLYEQHTAHLHPSSDNSALAARFYRTYSYALPEEAASYLAATLGCKGAKALADGHVTLRVSQNMLEADTGCWTWPAGLYLTEFLLTFPQLFTHLSCLELGSGAGMAGICLTRLAPSKVVLSDGDLTAIANLRHNLKINGIACGGEEPSLSNVVCRHMVWERVSDEELSCFDADVILGSDVVYNPECIVHLIRVLKGLLNRPRLPQHSEEQPSVSDDSASFARPVAYLASVVRNKETMDIFLERAKEANLRVSDITETVTPQKCLADLNSYNRSEVLLHKISSL